MEEGTLLLPEDDDILLLEEEGHPLPEEGYPLPAEKYNFKHSKIRIWATNRLPMAPFGTKLGQNESYGLQAFFKRIPALREPIFRR